jgi:hypothetical protein
MSTVLPADLIVTELPDGGVHYRLPVRPFGPARYFAFVPILFGSIIATWPFAAVGFFLINGRPNDTEFLVFVALAWVFFGAFCWPVAGFMVYKGLTMAAGHVEIAVRDGRLLAANKVGRFGRTRGRPLARVRGFHVESGLVVPRPGAPMLFQDRLTPLAHLKADLSDGSSFVLCHGYPRDWLLALADDLARRCRRDAVPDRASAGTALPVQEESLNPTVIAERPVQPLTSPARVEENVDGCTVTIPPVGVGKANQPFVLLWVAGWNAFLVLFTAVLIPALLTEGVKWEGTDEPVSTVCVVLFLVPFYLIGVVSLLVVVRRGRRWARIEVTGDALAVEEVMPLSHPNHRWERTDLADVRVASRDLSTDESTYWKTELCVRPREGPEVRILGHRPKAELEWLATLIRQRLRLPAAPAPAEASRT